MGGTKEKSNNSIFIGTYYGKQEKASREEIEREFSQLSTQIGKLSKILSNECRIE